MEPSTFAMEERDSTSFTTNTSSSRPRWIKGRHLDFLMYYLDFIIIVSVPILLLPLPIVVKTPPALCGYMLILMGVYWCTEALPLGVTSLIPVFLGPLFGLMTTEKICPLYFKDVNMMLLGGLFVALAVEKSNFHRRVALRVLLTIGVSPRWLMLGFMIPTWILSMWISNTATTAMMMPIVIEVIQQMQAASEVEGEVAELDELNVEGKDNPTKKNSVYPMPKVESVPNISVVHVNSQTDLVAHMENAAALDVPKVENVDTQRKDMPHMAKALVLSVAYAANCGGIGTLIGTTTNLICKGVADELWRERLNTDSPINFATWMAWGVPISFLNIIVVWVWLSLYFIGPRRFFGVGVKRNMRRENSVKAIIIREYQKLGKLSAAEIQVCIVFLILVLLWFFRKPDFIPGWANIPIFKKDYIGDAVPAVFIGVILFVLRSNYPTSPSKGDKPDYLMDWDLITAKFPWGVVLLLGGGFALADCTKYSGLSAWLGNKLTVFRHLPGPAMVLILTYLVTLVTQFTSNTAAATLMLPIIRSMAVQLDINPLYLMLPVTVATQLAFMLPVATPPNAVAFTSGYITVMDMVKAGAVLNILCSLVALFATQTYGMPLFKLNENPFHTVQNVTLTTILPDMTTASMLWTTTAT